MNALDETIPPNDHGDDRFQMSPAPALGQARSTIRSNERRRTPSEGRLVVVLELGEIVVLGVWGRPSTGSTLVAATDERITGQDLVKGDPAVVAFGPLAAELGGVDQRQARMVVVGVQLAQERGQHHGGACPDLVLSQCGDQAAPHAYRLDRVDDVLSGPGRARRREPTQGWDEPSWAL